MIMDFKKYQHVERYGTSEVEGIELGECYIFPKIDGTNGSVWVDEVDDIQCGSRRRHLTEEQDNANFWHYAVSSEEMKTFFYNHPELRLFGEWLVPHSLKTYQQNAWKKFYIFDVVEDLPEELPSGEKFRYLSYAEYQPILESFGLEYIPPIKIINNASYEQLIACLDHNSFLIEDGKGYGEGIVIKNYDFTNRYGRTTWAKIVTNEFKAKHSREMGAPTQEGKQMVETEIVEEFCTETLIRKTYAKILVEQEGWQSQYIPQLLNTVYYELVKEDCWNFVKKHKNPSINFKTLLTLCQKKTKTVLAEVF